MDGGFIAANGLKDSRVDTVSDNRPRPRRGTRARGRVDFRMDTVQRPTRTAVSSTLIVLLYCKNAGFSLLLRAFCASYVGGDIECGILKKAEWDALFT